MNRAEFMRRLTELLGDVPPMEREEAIQYYNDYFDDAGEENEGSVIASLGTPEELAKTIKTGLNDGGNGGEFTESGFSGYTQLPKDEVIRAEDVNTAEGSGNNAARTGNEQSGSTQYGNDYYEGAYYRRPQGEGIYGGRKDTRTDSNPYENTGAQSDTWNSAYGQNNTQNASYGQDRADHTANGQTGGQYQSYSRSGSKKEPMSGGDDRIDCHSGCVYFPGMAGTAGRLFRCRGGRDCNTVCAVSVILDRRGSVGCGGGCAFGNRYHSVVRCTGRSAVSDWGFTCGFCGRPGIYLADGCHGRYSDTGMCQGNCFSVPENFS